MVNFVEALRPILHFLIKLVGLRPLTLEIEPGTVMSLWVPKHKANMIECAINNEILIEEETIVKDRQNKDKPVVVLVHGFAADGTMTWLSQIISLVKQYDVYVPDLLFFGGSKTTSANRSLCFQAECLIKSLERLGVEKCTVAGFSYGGMVAFKMAEIKPNLVENLVISGSVIELTESINREMLARLGMESFAELLMPESAKSLKTLRSISMYADYNWLPTFLFKDFLEVMFDHKKERSELLKELVISDEDASLLILPQRIFLLWGENDDIFTLQFAEDIKQQLGERTTIQTISKAGHLVHVERPFQFNRHLKEFLANIYYE